MIPFPQNTTAFLVHEAGEPGDGGRQRCARCGRLMNGGLGTLAAGQLVAISDSGSVRLMVREPNGYPPCSPPPAPDIIGSLPVNGGQEADERETE